MKRTRLAAAFLLLAGCTVPQEGDLPAPQPDPYSTPPTGWLEAPRVFALIGEREALGLTSEQVTALDSINSWVSEQNRELESEIHRKRGRAVRSRGMPTPAAQAEIRPLAQQVAENNQRAMEGVAAVLTPEQRRKVCETASGAREGVGIGPLSSPGRDPRLPGDRMGVRGTGPRSVRGDSLFVLRRGWSWCGQVGTGE